MQPALLLFLHRLQCLCVSDVLQAGNSNVMLKRQLGKNVVELRHGHKAQHAQHWLVVRWVRSARGAHSLHTLRRPTTTHTHTHTLTRAFAHRPLLSITHTTA
jgi:hypothetical protein